MAPAELESPHRALGWTLARYAALLGKSSELDVWRLVEQHSLAPFEQRLRAAGQDPSANDMSVVNRRAF